LLAVIMPGLAKVKILKVSFDAGGSSLAVSPAASGHLWRCARRA